MVRIKSITLTLNLREQFYAPLVTADDDLLYPRYWLTMLIEANRKFPRYVNCFWAQRCRLITAGLADMRLKQECNSTIPSFRNYPHWRIGIIYPPRFLIGSEARRQCVSEIVARKRTTYGFTFRHFAPGSR